MLMLSGGLTEKLKPLLPFLFFCACELFNLTSEWPVFLKHVGVGSSLSSLHRIVPAMFNACCFTSPEKLDRLKELKSH